jgi:hypothetical protein
MYQQWSATRSFTRCIVRCDPACVVSAAAVAVLLLESERVTVVMTRPFSSAARSARMTYGPRLVADAEQST